MAESETYWQFNGGIIWPSRNCFKELA